MSDTKGFSATRVASVPGLPLTYYVRVLIARGWANRRAGKAWNRGYYNSIKNNVANLLKRLR